VIGFASAIDLMAASRGWQLQNLAIQLQKKAARQMDVTAAPSPT
jgi:hypothetical protein